MDIYMATEQAYKNGYSDGYRDAYEDKNKYMVINEYIEQVLHNHDGVTCEFATKEAHDIAFQTVLNKLYKGLIENKKEI